MVEGGGGAHPLHRPRRSAPIGGTLFVKNGINKRKGLDLGAEPPRINLC